MLELEAVDLEPNRGYPQALEIAGFRLAVTYLDATSGEPLPDQGVKGPRSDHAVALAPGEKKTVADLVLELPPVPAPGAGELRLLVLEVVMASGTSFAVEVARAEGR